jgi:alkanesulfonate monooxygenase SsuD/methylene tetrahydromethanopterin reductase-like flavin-dependent oxidoreductase (luciferase family)
MRFAWALTGPLAGAANEAADAEAAGFDAVWIERADVEPAALAAHLALATTGLRIGVTTTIGADHPIELAEQIAVADLALNGRLVLAVRPAPATESRFAEALDLLLDCFGSHPFRHEGEAWRVPANFPANVFNVENRVRVTPATAQFELPVWVAGAVGRDAATERGLGVLIDADERIDEMATWWAQTRAARPALTRRMRRARRWRVPGAAANLDADAAVDELRAGRRAVDLDVVVAESAGVDPPDRAGVMTALMRLVRPRVQLDRYPPGLEEHWAQHAGGTTHG